MKTKEEDKRSGVGADIALECLRCAEGAGGSGRATDLGCPFMTSQTQTTVVCAIRRSRTVGTKRECI